jgi:hypothetical protein
LTERPVEREGPLEPRRHAVVDGPIPAPGHRPRRRSRRGKQTERREGRRVPGYVADTLADVCGTGLVMVIGLNGSGIAWVALTDVDCSRYARLGGTPHRPELLVPDPQFPIKTPTGGRASRPVPSSIPAGQPDPSSGRATAVEKLRWACNECGPIFPAVSERWTALPGECASLPVHSPGAHLHSLLRRSSVADRIGVGDNSR